MARIKCRYTIPYCEYNGRHEQQFHNEYWFCDSNDGCDIGQYTESEDPDALNPTCVFRKNRYGEFELDVDSYIYDGDLTINEVEFREWDILYLEIDGRVLVE